jgi:hypothetical protein
MGTWCYPEALPFEPSRRVHERWSETHPGTIGNLLCGGSVCGSSILFQPIPMTDGLGRILVVSVAGYLVAGVLFAIPFAVRWAGRLDPAARAGTWGFRAMILPGAVLLWPLLAARLRSAR